MSQNNSGSFYFRIKIIPINEKEIVNYDYIYCIGNYYYRIFAEAIRQEIKYRDQQIYYAALNRKIEDDFENLNRRYGTNLPTKIK